MRSYASSEGSDEPTCLQKIASRAGKNKDEDACLDLGL